MSGYRRITPRERCQIEILMESGISLREIARRLRFSASTISRELKKSKGSYVAEVAEDESARRRLKRSQTRQVIKGNLETIVREKLSAELSPEQIAGWLWREKRKRLSIKTIYSYIERDAARGGSLKSKLRILKKQRRDRKAAKWRKRIEKIKNRMPIEKRPKIVERRIRLGDIERDTVFGKKNGPLLLTMVDRRSRYVYIELIARKCSKLIHRATVKALRSENIKTITNDNGSEFARHELTSQALNVQVYFSRAYASWERGTNENTNGLIRQYVPRKKDMSWLTPKEVQKIADKLNNRPRKCLKYQTPLQVHLRLRKNAKVLR